MPLPSMTSFQRNAVALARAERQMFRDLVKVREESSQSASAVAKKLDRHRSAVTRFENQEGDPRLSTVLRYAAAVGAMLEITVKPFDTWERETSAALGVKRKGQISQPSTGWGSFSPDNSSHAVPAFQPIIAAARWS